MATHTPYKALVNGGNSFDNQPAISEPGGFDITVDFLYYVGGTPDAAEGDATHTTLDTAGALAAADVIYLARIPKGATILDFYLDIPLLETSGGQITVSLGFISSGNSAAFINAGTGPRAALTIVGTRMAKDSINGAVANTLPYPAINVVTAGVPTAVGGGFPGDDIFALTCVAASSNAGTATAATAIKGWIKYHCRGRGVW